MPVVVTNDPLSTTNCFMGRLYADSLSSHQTRLCFVAPTGSFTVSLSAASETLMMSFTNVRATRSVKMPSAAESRV